MSDASGGRKLVAFLAGEVIDVDRLMEGDEAGAVAALIALRDDIVLPALAAVRGRIVETADDRLLIRLGSAADAVSCAVAIQNGLAGHNAERAEDRRVSLRLGADIGLDQVQAVVAEVAAALAPQSDAGGLCVSSSVEEQIRGKLHYPLFDGGEREIAGLSKPLRIFRLSPGFSGTIAPLTPSDVESTVTAQLGITPGVLLNDTYQIDALIAKGGMGEIFRAHEIHSDGVIAIKLIRLDMTGNTTVLGLFQKEARVLKDIQHDAIVRYYTFSFDPHLRRYYLAMEFVDGVSLSDLAQRGPLGFETVSALRRRVASGLQVAHARGIIHRDVSPDNIIVPGGDVSRAKIIDFGIARAEDRGESLIDGGFAGKYNYVPPEQLGLFGGQITPQSDIYSFGLVLAEISLGEPIDMRGSHAEIIEKRRTVPDLGRIDPRLRPLIERMLQPDPADRPASMAEVADWPLADAPAPAPAIAAVHRSATPPVRATKAPPRPPERHIERWIVGGALALALLGGGGIAGYEAWIARRPAEAPHAGQPPRDDDGKPAEGAGPPVDHAPPGNGAADAGTAQPPPPPPSPVVTYVRSYDGGGCFFARPVKLTSTSAMLDAFAMTKDALVGFDQAFTRQFGFSPEIAGSRVWSRQCPALDFLRQVARGGTAPPTLLLKSTRIGRGQPLVGEIQGLGAQSVAMLQVQEDGTVLDLTRQLKQDGDAETFEIGAPGEAGKGATPQLLLVLASPQPLAALAGAGPLQADTIFPAILAEASRGGVALGAAAKLFLSGGP